MADFNEVVRQIEDSEKNVDKVLKAGRLERHEKEPMSLERLTLILNYTVGTIAMVLGFGIIYLIIYFMGRQKGTENEKKDFRRVIDNNCHYTINHISNEKFRVFKDNYFIFSRLNNNCSFRRRILFII